MGKKPVDDPMNEVIRKAAQDSSDGLKYDLRTIISEEINAALNNSQYEHLISINEKMLKQLKIMNIHLSLITNNEIENKEV